MDCFCCDNVGDFVDELLVEGKAALDWLGNVKRFAPGVLLEFDPFDPAMFTFNQTIKGD